MASSVVPGSLGALTSSFIHPQPVEGHRLRGRVSAPPSSPRPAVTCQARGGGGGDWGSGPSANKGAAEKPRSLRASSAAGDAGGGHSLASAIDWVAIPAWLVRTLAQRVYPARPCSPGMYFDPHTQACVYVCRPGFAYDRSTRACVSVAAIKPSEWRRGGLQGGVVGGGPKVEEVYVLRRGDGGLPPAEMCGEGFAYDEARGVCVLEEEHPGDGPLRTVAKWLAQRLLPLGGDACPVGFYVDPTSDACVPLCSEGFTYDPVLKRCVPARATDY